MRYFVLLMALVLSSCSHDIRVNDGWVIYDLRPLDGGCIDGATNALFGKICTTSTKTILDGLG